MTQGWFAFFANGTRQQLRYGAQSGGIFETYVVGKILKSYYNAGKEPPNDKAEEVDLLFYQNGIIYPVEIKKTSSPDDKDIKHFKILETAFTSLKIGAGGLICTYDKVLSPDERIK